MPEAKDAFAIARELSDEYQQNSRGDRNAQP
jgi:hypothetical protein